MPNAIQMKQALDRANEKSMLLPVYPVNQRLAERYPGINMKGKYSVIDVSLSNDLQNIRSAAKRKPPQVQEALDLMITASEPLKKAMLQTSVTYRQAEIAQQLTDNPALNKDLEEMKDQIRRRSEVQDYARFIHAAKCMVGLERVSTKDKFIQKFCKDTLKCPLDMKAMEMGQDQSTHVPSKLEIHFEDMNPMVEFLHYSSSAVLANENPSKVPMTAGMYTAKIDRIMPRYANVTLDRELQLFDAFDDMAMRSPSEERNLYDISRLYDDPELGVPDQYILKREDLISINGVSLRQLTDANFKGVLPWNITQEQRHDFQNSLLTQALLTQEQVECYPPDYKNKTISTEPVKMTLEGIEPKKLEPPVMNGWQRYWSKHGYYKDLAAKAAKYESTIKNQADMKARMKLYSSEVSNTWNDERVNSSTNYISQSKDQLDKLSTKLYGEAFTKQREGINEGSNFRMQRSGINLAICDLVNRGLSANAILGSDRLMDHTKTDSGTKLNELAQRDDPKELVALVLPAMKKIIELPNIDMDYADPRDLERHSKEIYVRAAVFDLWQEITRPGKVENGVGHDGSKNVLENTLGKEEAERFSEKAGNFGLFYRKLDEYARSAASGARNYDKENMNKPEVISSAIVMEQLLKDHGAELRLGENPGNLVTRDEIETLNMSATMAVMSLSEPEQDNVLSAVVNGKPIAALNAPLRMGEIAEFEILAAKPAPAPILATPVMGK